ncbi:MAG: hypothetical protein WBP79_03395 [Candidatus Acidiferrales bacterium]
MRHPAHLLAFVVVAILAVSSAAQTKKNSHLPSSVLSAKSVFFDDNTGSAAVGNAALQRLKKWGRFQIVKDKKEADLVLLLSAEPYNGGSIIYSGGQTGSVDRNGNIQPDPVPTFNKQTPVRYAYLTVIDPKTGKNLWSAEHQWGDLLTGFNSVGARLINKLRKQIEK